MEDWRAERFPLCCACGEVVPEPPPPLPPPDTDPLMDLAEQDIIPADPDIQDPEVSKGFLERTARVGIYTVCVTWNGSFIT